MCQIGLGGLKSLFLLCATVTWLAGLGLFVLSHLATKSQGLKRADDMVKADTMDGDGVPISLHLFFLSLLTVGVLSLFFSVCACTGVALKKRTFIVAYVFGCMFLGVAALTITMLMGDVYAVLLPTMRRQITEFCLPDAYATFSYELRTKEPRDLTCVATATRPKEAPDGAVIALRRSLEGETDLQRALMTSPQHDEVRALSTAISSAAVPARKNDVQELRLAEVEHQPQRTKATMFLPRITNFAKTVGLLKGGEKLELITDAETEWDEDEKMLPKRIEESDEKADHVDEKQAERSTSSPQVQITTSLQEFKFTKQDEKNLHKYLWQGVALHRGFGMENAHRLLSDEKDGKKNKTNGTVQICGELCDERVVFLRAMGGCKTLHYMCEVHSDHSPAILHRFAAYTEMAVFYMFVYVGTLFLSAFIGIWLLYALVTGRVGKKGGGLVMMKILFPCFTSSRATSTTSGEPGMVKLTTY